MKIELHDATPSAPGERHGPGGPTHCANITVDYEYQLEQWLIDLPGDMPEVVRVVDRATRRVWRRDGQRFVPARWPLEERVEAHPWAGAIVRSEGFPGTWRVEGVVMREDMFDLGPPAEAALRAWADLVSVDGRQRAVAPLEKLTRPRR